ncbi:dihydrofolate reductase [Hymenobacter lutimineralis]|uniref:Dihydrofolate reductase n=1 Tax=Hymenobacter lutimineralis TaxID=2606448 RepID=A0A5D6V0S4_9BACT|nr:dihydrofolate reductase family protein [Hymenobacter lutimineralis]TYZ08855.1 dihydrofolate reductase [Hymenobacter lutimineralis]
MRKVVFYIAASLDGYIASPDGSVDWLPAPPPGEDYGYADFLATVDATLQGRTTYEQVLTFGEWPYPTLTNYVFSRQLAQSPVPSVQLVADDPVQYVTALKQHPGGTIWLIGGSSLAAPLLAAGLVDELMLFVVPQVLGAGIPLWQPGLRLQPTRLLHTRTWPDGMALLHYQL